MQNEEEKMQKDIDQIISQAFKDVPIKFSFTERDYIKYHCFLTYINNIIYYTSVKANSKININNFQKESTKNFISKGLYILLYDVMMEISSSDIKNKFFLLEKLTELYIQGFFSETEILLYVKFLIILGSKKTNILRFSYLLLDMITRRKNDNNISNQMIYNVIKFTKETIVQNNKKKYKLAMTNIVDLLMFDHVNITEQTQKSINDLLAQMYLFQYKNDLFFSLLKSSISHFDNNSMTFNKSLDAKVNLVHSIISEELNFPQNDPFNFLNGFLFEKKQTDGIELKTFDNVDNKRKEFTIVFSFKHLHQKNKKIVLLEICETNSEGISKDNCGLRVVIDTNSLYVEEGNLKFPSGKTNKECIPIFSGTSYLVILSQQRIKQNQSIISLTVNGNTIIDDKFKAFPTQFDYFSIKMGTSSLLDKENNFYGYMGTLLLFNECLDMKVIKQISTLKGNYDILLFCAQNKKYLEQQFDIYIDDAIYKEKILDKIDGLISTYGIKIFNEKKKRYKENFLDLKQLRDNKKYFTTGKYITPLSTRISTYEFIKLEGIKFLQLHCEYYMQLIEKNGRKVPNDLYDKIANAIDNIINLVELIIKTVELPYFEERINNLGKIDTLIDIHSSKMDIHSNELMFLFSSITQLILKIATTFNRTPQSSINKIMSILSLITLNISPDDSTDARNNQSSEDFKIALRNKLIFFLMNKALYIKNEEVLSATCSSIISCFENNCRGLLVQSFLDVLLSYDKNIMKTNKNFRRLLELYVKEIIAKNRKEVIFDYLKKLMNLSEDIKNIEEVEYMTMILCKHLINYSIELKKEGEEISDDEIYRNFFINELQILNGMSSDEYKEKMDIIKCYLIQSLQIVECDYKAYNFIIENVKFSYNMFLSFYLLNFEMIPLSQFKALISLPLSTQSNGIEQLHINYLNLDLKMEFVISIINMHENKEEKEEMRKIYRNFLYRLSSELPNICNSKSTEKTIQRIFHKKSILYQFFVNFPINIELQKDIKVLTFVIFSYCKRPFIFKLLFTLFLKSKYSTDDNLNTVSIVNEMYRNIVSVNLKEISLMDNSNEIMNQVYTLIFFYQLISLSDAKKSLDKYKEIFKIFNMNSIIIGNRDLLFNRMRFIVGYVREGGPKKAMYKYLSEIVIEILIELYLLTKQQSYLIMLEDLILKPPDKSILSEVDSKLIDNQKEKTSFLDIFKRKKKEDKFNIDKLRSNEKKFCDPPYAKFYDVSYLIFYYVKFSLYSLNRKKKDTNLDKLYTKIKLILYNEIKNINPKIKKKIFDNEYDDKLYQKMKTYFVYDLIKKKISKMKLQKGESSESEDKFELTDIDELILKKTKKDTYKGYRDYFKLGFDKNQKGKYDDCDISPIEKEKTKATKTFAAVEVKDKIEQLSPIEDNEEHINKKIPLFSEDIYTKEQLYNKLSENISEFYQQHKEIDDTKYNDFFYYSFPYFNERKVFLYVTFSEFFKDQMFTNKVFQNLMKDYKKKFYYSYIDNSNITYLQYPSKVKNYLSTKSKVRVFLKPDLKFFTNEYIKVSHTKLFDFLTFKNNLITFKNRIYDKKDILTSQIINLINSKEDSYRCELINIEGSIYGKLILLDYYIVFISDNENDPRIDKKKTATEKMPLLLSSLENDILKKRKILFIKLSHISYVFIRRFLYSMQANEIYLKNNHTYFFNFLSKANNDKYLSQLNKKMRKDSIIFDLKSRFNADQYVSKWMKGTISTFNFISMLNFFSCRSFNDLNQYPIFPWLTTSFDNNGKVNISIRNFSYPVSAQDKAKRLQLMKKYDLSTPTKNGYINHFNSHYSTGAFVSFFMVRTNPFTYNMIGLQNGQFDHPNRAFHSFYEIQDILTKYNDNRELIPEVFYFPEMFINLNFNNLGQRTNDKIRNHNLLFEEYYENNINSNDPPSNNPVEFMCRYRRFLESKIVSKKINEWINNVFGVYQIIKNNEENKARCNSYSKFCYSEFMNFEEKVRKCKEKKMSDEEIWKKLRGKICCVLNFGQTPMRILDNKLPNKVDIAHYPMRRSQSMYKAKSVNVLESPLDQVNNIIHKPLSEYENKALLIFDSTIIHNKRAYFIMQKKKKIFDIYMKDNEDRLVKTKINIVSPSFGYYNIFRSPYDHRVLSNKNKYVYDLRNTFAVVLKGDAFVFSNYLDNSIKLFYWKKNQHYSFITSSFVTSIVKIKDLEFITGHENGMITHWLIDIIENNISLTKVKSVICQQSEVMNLYYDFNTNVIINADSEGVISMRNIFSYELITSFKPSLPDKQAKLAIVKLEINQFNNLLYILAYDIIKKYYILFGYTVNGIGFSKILNVAGSFHILKNGNIICYSYAVKAFIIVRGERLNKFIDKVECVPKDKLVRFVYVEEEQKIHYLIKKKEDSSLYLDTKELTPLDISKINKEDEYLEGKKSSIWDTIEYDNDIFEGKEEKKEEENNDIVKEKEEEDDIREENI